MENLKIASRVSSEQVDTVSLTFTWPDPAMCEKLPNYLVQRYFDSVSEQIKTRLKQSCDFLSQRVDEAKKGLQEAAGRRMKYQADHAQQYPEPGSFQARVSQLTADIQNLRPQLDLAKQREAHLLALGRSSTQPGATKPAEEVWGPNPERGRLTDELARIREDLDNSTKIKGMKEQHPYVIGLKKRIADLEDRIAKTPPTVKLNDVYSTGVAGTIQRSLDLAAVEAEIRLVGNRLSDAKSELDHLQTHAAEYAKVARDYAELIKTETERSEEVGRWNVRLSDLQMQLGAEVANRATIQATIQPAKRPYVPSSPNPLMVWAGSVLIALATGAGVAFLASMMDRSVSSADLAEEWFDLPVHGTIGEIVTPAQRRARLAKRALFWPAAGAVLLAMVAAAGWTATLRLTDQDRYAQVLHQPLTAIEAALGPEKTVGGGR